MGLLGVGDIDEHVADTDDPAVLAEDGVKVHPPHLMRAAAMPQPALDAHLSGPPGTDHLPTGGGELRPARIPVHLADRPAEPLGSGSPVHGGYGGVDPAVA